MPSAWSPLQSTRSVRIRWIEKQEDGLREECFQLPSACLALAINLAWTRRQPTVINKTAGWNSPRF